MSTIRERWDKYMEDRKGLITTSTIIEGFVQSERALQRQECAEAAATVWQANGFTWPDFKDAILAAGTDKPQNPFGCGCWKQVQLNNEDWMRLTDDGFYVVLRKDSKCCDQCGAKRREK